MKDYYELLEVSRNASKETINKVFKMHMKANHPDLFQGEEKAKAEEKSKELTEAYNILSDDFQREKYDAELRESETNPEQLEAIIQENEYLKQVLAQKDSYIAQLTNNINASQGYGYGYAPPPGGMNYQQRAQYYQERYRSNATPPPNPYDYETYQNPRYQGEDPNDPYAGMTLEELQQLKKEQTKIYYKERFKEAASKFIVLGLLLIVLLIALRSSLSQISGIFGDDSSSNNKPDTEYNLYDF